MKTKKLLSILSAAALTVTALSGSILTVNAEEEYITNLTFAGTEQNEDVYPIETTGNYHSESRAESYNWTAEGQDELKELYDTDNDGVIDDVFVNSYFDYIGNYVDVSINVSNLQPGNYTIYYGGVSGIITEASLDDGTKLAQGSKIVLHNEADKAEFMVIPFTISFTDNYSGKITFKNSGGWLPDLCSIKIVGVGFNTQEDVIQADDIVRESSYRDQFTGYTINETNYAKVPVESQNRFGSNLENVGNVALSYTDDTDDYTYLNVTEDGTYAVDIIGAASTRDQKITFTNLNGSNTDETLVTDSVTNIATATKTDGSEDAVHYFTSIENVVLTKGMYRVGIIKNSDAYYTNFIAMALRPVAEPEPEEDPKFVTDCKNLGVAEGTGTNANTYATMFGIKVINNGGAGTFNTVKASVTRGSEESRNLDAELSTGITLNQGASIVIGAIIDGLNDDAATMTATVE